MAKFELRYRQVQHIDLIVEADTREAAELTGKEEMDRANEYFTEAGVVTIHLDTMMSVRHTDTELIGLINIEPE